MLRSTRPQGKNTRGGSPLLVKVCPQQRVCSYKAKDGADPLPAVSRIPHHWASAPDPLALTPGQVPEVWLPPALQLFTCPPGPAPPRRPSLQAHPLHRDMEGTEAGGEHGAHPMLEDAQESEASASHVPTAAEGTHSSQKMHHMVV